MNPEEQNKVLQAWQTSAPYWDKYRALITQMFAPITTGLIEETAGTDEERCRHSTPKAAFTARPGGILL
jgi:hypothetical protein